MLAGEGNHRDMLTQLGYPPGAYPQISTAALRAWRKLPCSTRKSEDLSKVRQGPEEPYQDFLARLMEAIGKVIGDEQACMVLAKQLAFENANSACQAALRPYRKKGDLSDYVRICSDIGPSYVQGVALAAALQGKSMKEVLFQQHQKGKKKGTGQGKARVPGPPGSCYGCGKMGHLMAQCPQKQTAQNSTKNNPPPNVCPRCKKGKHWARDCRSKADINGQPLTQQGNWKRGQPQAPQQCYGAMQGLPLVGTAPEGGNQLGNYSGPPQGAQDWTSVPLPTQY